MMSDYATSVTALTTNPESVSLRLDVVTNAQRTAQNLNSMSADTQQLRQEADSQISDAIGIVNTQLTTIDKLNDQIVAAKLRGIETGDLEDQRDLAVSKISEQMDISTYTRENGQMVVFTKAGRTLLDGDPSPLTHTPAASLQAAVTYPGGIDGITVNGADITSEIGSGKIAALVQLRDTTLPNFTAEIDQLATKLRDEVNKIHNQGTGLPAAKTLTSSRPQTGTAASLTGTVTVTLLNPDRHRGLLGPHARAGHAGCGGLRGRAQHRARRLRCRRLGHRESAARSRSMAAAPTASPSPAARSIRAAAHRPPTSRTISISTISMSAPIRPASISPPC